MASDRSVIHATAQEAAPTRRLLLKTGGVAAVALSAPFVGNAQAAETTTWKVQTSWPAGVGLTHRGGVCIVHVALLRMEGRRRLPRNAPATERPFSVSAAPRFGALRPSIRSGWTVIGVAAATRSTRPSGRYWFMRNPTVPRFIPKIGRPSCKCWWMVWRSRPSPPRATMTSHSSGSTRS